PYPRLALPWLLAAWLGMSLNCADLLHPVEAWPAGQSFGRLKNTLVAAAILSIFLVPMLFLPHDDHVKQSYDRRGLLRIAQQVRETERPREVRAIYVYGEPALFFQLRAAGEEIVAPIQYVPDQAA